LLSTTTSIFITTTATNTAIIGRAMRELIDKAAKSCLELQQQKKFRCDE